MTVDGAPNRPGAGERESEMETNAGEIRLGAYRLVATSEGALELRDAGPPDEGLAYVAGSIVEADAE